MTVENDEFCEACVSFNVAKHEHSEDVDRPLEACTKDGSLDKHGKPAIRKKTGQWRCGMFILVNQALATLAFTGVEVNMVIFLKSVLGQTNAEAASSFSAWIGSFYLFSLVGAFLSDSYLGRYLTCLSFQVIFIIGLITLTFSTHVSLLNPDGCGTIEKKCYPPSSLHVAIFFLSIYSIAIGNGGPEAALATFGADQFDEEDREEERSKSSFFKYFYVALNLGSLVSETILVYVETHGHWILVFWICTCSAIVAFMMFLSGRARYRHFKPSGNPISRFLQVIVAATKKMKQEVPLNGEGLYEVLREKDDTNITKKLLHTDEFRCLDRAAIILPKDMDMTLNIGQNPNPWQLCSVTQVEEVKCVLRLMPIWFCTILSSVVFIQMISLFVEQGATMDRRIGAFHIPPASMTAFDIISTSIFIISYDKVIVPLYIKITKREPKPPSELKRIGIGLLVAICAMTTAGFIEKKRLSYGIDGKEISSMHILWQTPQYVLVGISEAFVYVAQLEFFSSQTPEGLKSLGISLPMSSSAVGSYICSLLLTLVMKITARNGSPGWVPPNLNQGHLDNFFFLSAALTTANLGLFIVFAKRFKFISAVRKSEESNTDGTP